MGKPYVQCRAIADFEPASWNLDSNTDFARQKCADNSGLMTTTVNESSYDNVIACPNGHANTLWFNE